jgi:hypothetical protein
MRNVVWTVVMTAIFRGAFLRLFVTTATKEGRIVTTSRVGPMELDRQPEEAVMLSER